MDHSGWSRHVTLEVAGATVAQFRARADCLIGNQPMALGTEKCLLVE